MTKESLENNLHRHTNKIQHRHARFVNIAHTQLDVLFKYPVGKYFPSDMAQIGTKAWNNWKDVGDQKNTISLRKLSIMKYMCRIQPRLFNFYVFIFVLVKVPSFNGNFTENKAEAVTKLIGLSP